jgi:hypothetical protein
MLVLKHLPFEPSPPVLGQAVPFLVEGKGYGILYGPPWLNKTDRVQKLRAKRFRKAVMFRKTPVSKSRPYFPFLKTRPRLVKAGETVWIVANKPKTRVVLRSLRDFNKWSFNLNPKGIVAQSPGVKLDIKTVKSKVSYNSLAQNVELQSHQPILNKTQIQLTDALKSNFHSSKLSLKNTFLSSQEINILSQQNK